MTFIGGRTVTNCTVYEIVTSSVLDVTRSVYGTGEVEKTRKQVTEALTFHVIANSEDLARALFKTSWGSEFQRHTLQSIKPLFVIDGEINTGYS